MNITSTARDFVGYATSRTPTAYLVVAAGAAAGAFLFRSHRVLGGALGAAAVLVAGFLHDDEGAPTAQEGQADIYREPAENTGFVYQYPFESQKPADQVIPLGNPGRRTCSGCS